MHPLSDPVAFNNRGLGCQRSPTRWRHTRGRDYSFASRAIEAKTHTIYDQVAKTHTIYDQVAKSHADLGHKALLNLISKLLL